MYEVQSSPSHRLSRRTFLTGAGVAAAGFALYAGELARHELEVTSQSVRIRDLPAGFTNLRIAQLSDIHLDEYTEPYFLEHVVRRINSLQPDVVLLTGDFVTRGSLTFVTARHAAQRCGEILSTLACAERYAILGNHDVAVGATLVTAALTRNAIPVLRNRFTFLSRGGDTLWIGGTADPGTDIPDLNQAIPERPTGPGILMCHAPDFADDVHAHRRGGSVDLMLSGHSHGGQIRLPILGPLVLPPLGRKYVDGSYRFGRMQLYVNRGLGTVGVPFRLNCPPELTVFRLESAT